MLSGFNPFAFDMSVLDCKKDNGTLAIDDDDRGTISRLWEERKRLKQEPVLELPREAVEALYREFPVTRYYDLAGYMAPNGDMLAFTGDGKYRDRDHREVMPILVKAGILPENAPRYQAISIMEMAGFIRLLSTNMEICREPTGLQERALSHSWIKMRGRGSFDMYYVDICTNDIKGNNIGSISIQYGANIRKMFDALDRYFKTGCLENRVIK